MWRLLHIIITFVTPYSLYCLRSSAQAVPLSLSSEPSDEQSHAHARPNCRLASMEDKIDAVLTHLLSGKGF